MGEKLARVRWKSRRRLWPRPASRVNPALAEFRDRARVIRDVTPEQGTRWPSLVYWGRAHGLTRQQMVQVLAEEIGYTDEPG